MATAAAFEVGRLLCQREVSEHLQATPRRLWLPWAPQARLAPPAKSQCAEKPCMGSFRELFSTEPTYKRNQDAPGFHALSLADGTCEGSGLGGAVAWTLTGLAPRSVWAAPLWVRLEGGALEGGLGPGTGLCQELKQRRGVSEKLPRGSLRSPRRQPGLPGLSFHPGDSTGEAGRTQEGEQAPQGSRAGVRGQVTKLLPRLSGCKSACWRLKLLK